MSRATPASTAAPPCTSATIAYTASRPCRAPWSCPVAWLTPDRLCPLRCQTLRLAAGLLFRILRASGPTPRRAQRVSQQRPMEPTHATLGYGAHGAYISLVSCPFLRTPTRRGQLAGSYNTPERQLALLESPNEGAPCVHPGRAGESIRSGAGDRRRTAGLRQEPETQGQSQWPILCRSDRQAVFLSRRHRLAVVSTLRCEGSRGLSQGPRRQGV